MMELAQQLEDMDLSTGGFQPAASIQIEQPKAKTGIRFLFDDGSDPATVIYYLTSNERTENDQFLAPALNTYITKGRLVGCTRIEHELWFD